MPVQVSCPNCGKELNAPESLIGKQAACPRCATHFPVAPPAQSSSPQAAPPPVPSTASPTNYYPPGMEPPAANPSVPVPTELPLPAVPTSPNQAPSAPVAQAIPQNTAPPNTAPPARIAEPIPPANPPIPAGPPQTATPIANNIPVPPAATPAPPVNKNGNAAPPPSTRKPSPRQAKSAKFVSGGAATTRINLGEDGQLPELVMEDKDAKPEPTTEGSESSRSILLVVALAVSVVSSVGMLFLETEKQQTRSNRKAEARQQIEDYYLGDENREPQPYQLLLRQGLLASAQGNERLARRRFRQVLDMIHSEDIVTKEKPYGVTAPTIANTPPCDDDLEKQLSTLLSGD